MATETVPVAHKRADHVFFPAMALLILAVVVIGFGQSYFLNGMMFVLSADRFEFAAARRSGHGVIAADDRD